MQTTGRVGQGADGAKPDSEPQTYLEATLPDVREALASLPPWRAPSAAGDGPYDVVLPSSTHTLSPDQCWRVERNGRVVAGSLRVNEATIIAAVLNEVSAMLIAPPVAETED